MKQKRTLKEIALELLYRYYTSERMRIDKYSDDMVADYSKLDKEFNRYREEIEAADQPSD